MPTVTGTFQFLSVIPRDFFVLFPTESEEGRGDKEESNTIDFFFFFLEMVYIYIYVYVSVCMYSVYYFVMVPIIFFPPKFAVILSPEGAFWLL